MVVPLVLIDLVTRNYPQLSTAFLPQIETYVLFIGGMITASSTLEAYNRPGTYKRMLFGLGALAFVCLWIFAIFGGGIAEVSYGPYFVRFDMSKIVYIVLIGISLKGLHVMQTFRSWRASELERSRKAMAEKAARSSSRQRRVVRTHRPSASFSSLTRVEYSVTADDEIGYASHLPERPSRAGQTGCSICGHPHKPEAHVCENCGAWLRVGKKS